MSSLNLKIVIPNQGVSKIMRFEPNMTVQEVCNIIQEKTQIGGKDHALFVPNPPGQEGVGRWLKPERNLEYYDLKTNDTVEYKKKHDVIKIKLVDDTIKTMLVDLSLPVNDIVTAIGSKMSIKNADEFSIQQESKIGQWLRGEMPLTEQVQTLDQVFLLRKKFFMNDANVDQDDPVQLHLVYCQSRDDIVSGRHPVTKDEAIDFAALQCQVQLGDFKPDTHKTGYLNFKEFLAPQWAKKDLEKLLYAEWKKLVGMNEVNARFRYVQKCRSLKTYGMTVFKVKERIPGKKKLTNTLLAFTRDSIIRMEFESKKVLKEYPFKHLLRWAASPETFTLDFGAHEEDYLVVVTKEGEAISSLVAGYIDLLLKKQRDTGIVIDDDDSELGAVSTVGRLGGLAAVSLTTNNFATGDVTYSQSVGDCSSAARAIEKMINDLFGEVAKISDSALSPAQRREQLELQARALAALAETIENLAKTGDRSAMNGVAQKIAVAIEQLITAARQANACGADPNGILMEATKGVSDALKNLLNAAATSANKPNDPSAREALARAQLAAQAALQKLAAASKGVYADEGFQALFKELAKAVSAETQIMLAAAEDASARIQDPSKKQLLQGASGSLDSSEQNWAKITEVLAAVAQDPSCKTTIEKAGKALEQSGGNLLQTARSTGVDSAYLNTMADAQSKLQDALQRLLGITDLPHMPTSKEAEEFTEAAQSLLQNCAAILASEGNPGLVKSQCAEVKNNATRLGGAGKAIIAGQSDPATKESLANYLKQVVEASKNLLTAAPGVITNPNDKLAASKLYDAATDLADATNSLMGDTGRQVAVSALYNSAKLAAAATTSLCTSSRLAHATLNDSESQAQLADASRAAGEAIQKLVGLLKDVTKSAPAGPQRRLTFNRGLSLKNVNSSNDLLKEELLVGAEQFAPTAYKLVSTSKGVSPKVQDAGAKQDLVYSSSNAAKAIHKMLANRKALKAVKGQLETVEALDEFRLAQADLDSAMIACETGILKQTRSKDDAIADMNDAIQELNIASRDVQTTAKSAPEDLGPSLKRLAAANTKGVSAGIALAASVEDKNLQTAILQALAATVGHVKSLMVLSKALGASPDDPGLNRSLVDAARNLEEALRKLGEAAKGVVPKAVEDQQAKAQSDIEDLAEKELRNAAEAIERCVARLNAATDAARQRAEEKGLDIDELNITEAILEASQAIAKSTALLVHAATAVQREFNSMAKEPKTASVYKRDPTWAQGLISAARSVAATVQHLVQAANDAAQGNASEEALIVAAQAVSAATAQLVTASTVKADPNSEAQRKLREASGKVAQATQQLVTAAKNAAQWEMEKEEMEELMNGSNDAGNKIQMMEKQMEILRREKELEALQHKLMSMRKNEYEGATLPQNNAKASAPPVKAAIPAPVKSAGPPPGRAPPPQGAPVGGAPRGPVPAQNLPPPIQEQAPVKTSGRPLPGPGGNAPQRQGGAPVRGPLGPTTLPTGGAPPPGRGPAPGRRGPPGRVAWNTNAILAQQQQQ